ncbi:MAG: hypothetical protein SPH07_08045 [Eubacteriales bacterium]|nr:hypothetical protein [Eubacteriales bacterium]
MKGRDYKCPICGEPTFQLFGNYRKDGLCAKHGKMANDGEIIQCELCGKWHNFDEECDCQIQTNNTTCIICGKESNGKHFCYDCWNKYRNKVLYLKIKNCKEFEKLDAEYESELLCDDGHFVKSPYEKLIDNWLYKENILHAYEKKIDIDRERDISPDFYIPEYNGIKDIYIEFWGYDSSNVKYQQIKEYKMAIYPELCKRDNITVVYLSKKEVDDNSFYKKIKYAEQGKVNE